MRLLKPVTETRESPFGSLPSFCSLSQSAIRVSPHRAGRREIRKGSVRGCIWTLKPEKHLVSPNLELVAPYGGQAAARIPWKNNVSAFYFKKQPLRQRQYWLTFLLYFSDSRIFLGCGKTSFSSFLRLKFLSFKSVHTESISVLKLTYPYIKVWNNQITKTWKNCSIS